MRMKRDSPCLVLRFMPINKIGKLYILLYVQHYYPKQNTNFQNKIPKIRTPLLKYLCNQNRLLSNGHSPKSQHIISHDSLAHLKTTTKTLHSELLILCTIKVLRCTLFLYCCFCCFDQNTHHCNIYVHLYANIYICF